MSTTARRPRRKAAGSAVATWHRRRTSKSADAMTPTVAPAAALKWGEGRAMEDGEGWRARRRDEALGLEDWGGGRESGPFLLVLHLKSDPRGRPGLNPSGTLGENPGVKSKATRPLWFLGSDALRTSTTPSRARDSWADGTNKGRPPPALVAWPDYRTPRLQSRRGRQTRGCPLIGTDGPDL